MTHTPAPGDETNDREFFEARVALAIAASRVEASKHRYPFNQHEDRTVEEATAGDVTNAMRHVDTREQAEKFLAGYADGLVLSGTYEPGEALKVARDNLRYGAEKTFSDESLLYLWRPVLSPQS